MIPFGSKSVTLSMLIDLLTSRCRSTQVKLYTGLIASINNNNNNIIDLWPQEMFTFSEMLALVQSESSFGAFVFHRRPAGLQATSDLVDLYSTNRADLLTNIDISDPVSEHCMVMALLELSAERVLPSSGLGPMKVIYDFRNVDWHKINKDLMNAPLLQAIQGTQDVECALAVWESIVTETLLRHIPITLWVPENQLTYR